MGLDIGRELRAVDSKDREFYDKLTDEERKAFSNFMMIRWSATVSGDPILQEYYLKATNVRLNKHFFDISSKDHAKLHWLLVTTISPGVGNMRHDWIGLKKKDAGKNKIRKFIEEQYPTLKPSDIDLMVKLNDSATVKALAKDLGMSDKDIKKNIL